MRVKGRAFGFLGRDYGRQPMAVKKRRYGCDARRGDGID
jgi:hypothetical protein